MNNQNCYGSICYDSERDEDAAIELSAVVSNEENGEPME